MNSLTNDMKKYTSYSYLITSTGFNLDAFNILMVNKMIKPIFAAKHEPDY